MALPESASQTLYDRCAQGASPPDGRGNADDTTGTEIACLDAERLRSDLLDAAAASDFGGCGQFIVMQNAILNADEQRLAALARDYGLSLSRYEVASTPQKTVGCA